MHLVVSGFVQSSVGVLRLQRKISHDIQPICKGARYGGRLQEWSHAKQVASE